MKKIYTFFALLLLCAVTAVAQTTVYSQGTQVTSTDGLLDGNKYVIRVSGVSYITESNSQYVAPNTQNSITSAAVFTFKANGSTWKVLNESTGNYWGTLTGSATGTFSTATEENAGDWTFSFNNNNFVGQSNGYYINRSSGVMHGWTSTIGLQLYNVESYMAIDNLDQLSNTKLYQIRCNRGYLSTYNGQIASTNYSEATLSGKNFAIISYENAYYLYSVEDAMFVQQDGTLGTYPNGSTVSFSATTSPLYQIKFGTNFLNVNSQNYGWVINTYSTPDDGNQFVIIEAGDFDPTDALKKFTDRTPYFEALNAAITAAGNVTFGTTLHTYVKSADFDNALATAQTTYTNEDATIEELTAATQALTTAIDACEMNMPTEGMFLRLRSVNGANAYLKAVAAGTQMTVTTTADVNTIFCYTADHKLVPYVHGIPINNVREIGNAGGDASIFTFVKGLNGSVGTYSIGATYSGNTNYLYSTGVDGSNADRNTYSADFINQNTWTLEEVTELPITLNSVDGTNYFATFSAPVAVRIEGATLNNVTPKANSISYKAVDTNLLPANTGVLLTGESGSATAYVVTDEVADAGYGLQAYDSAFTVEEADQTSKLFLGRGSQSGKAGFYKLGSAKTNGFKAYLNNSTVFGGAKEGLELEFAGVTGIENMENGTLNMENGAVYNLQGQRVNKAQKGVFIQNGRKVVLK